jgi:Zn-dependent membrane protease YugP
VARTILDRNNLSGVRVEPVAGKLTDHYDPRAKAVRLSEGNFRSNSIAAVSVAAHECGHAIQDGSGYVPMKLRAGLFPIVNFAGQLWFPLFFMAIILGIGTSLGSLFVQLAVIAFAGVLAFHVVTLPVEINASTRAYGILTRYGMLSRTEAGGTKRVLTAAAFTYIAAALTSLLTLLYLLALSRQ